MDPSARAEVDSTPTRYQTLRAVLGDPDMDAFFARWRAYVLGLRFE